jgi:hypothetical protein
MKQTQIDWQVNGMTKGSLQIIESGAYSEFPVEVSQWI